MVIRSAEWSDIPRLITYISAFHKVSPYSDIAFSPGAARLILQSLIQRPSACIFLHENGAIAGEIVPMKFSTARVAQEVFWWAEKDGMHLLKVFENWAEDMDVDLICMAALSGPRFERFYNRRGYAAKEAFYVRQL